MVLDSMETVNSKISLTRHGLSRCLSGCVRDLQFADAEPFGLGMGGEEDIDAIIEPLCEPVFNDAVPYPFDMQDGAELDGTRGSDGDAGDRHLAARRGLPCL